MSSCLQHLTLGNPKTSHFLPTHMHNQENILPFYAPLPCCKYPPSPDTLPKGNMWSAIPIALLSMFVTVGDGKQGSGPKGDDVL